MYVYRKAPISKAFRVFVASVTSVTKIYIPSFTFGRVCSCWRPSFVLHLSIKKTIKDKKP